MSECNHWNHFRLDVESIECVTSIMVVAGYLTTVQDGDGNIIRNPNREMLKHLNLVVEETGVLSESNSQNSNRIV